jgi:hypothetical protein
MFLEYYENSEQSEFVYVSLHTSFYLTSHTEQINKINENLENIDN